MTRAEEIAGFMRDAIKEVQGEAVVNSTWLTTRLARWSAALLEEEGELSRKLNLRKEYVVSSTNPPWDFERDPFLSEESARRYQEQHGGSVRSRWVGEWTIVPKRRAS